MQISAETLIKAVGCSKADSIRFVYNINYTLDKFNISTKEQIAMFLAQTGHETNSFRKLDENFNYSEERLLAVFPKYFTKDEARIFARKPEPIANRVYANRMGNIDPGDGYKYRGRGLIHITGRFNYMLMAKSLNVDLINKPELLEQPEYACLSAGQFWQWNNLNNVSNIRVVTRRVNGGLNGLEDRTERYLKALEIL